MKIGQGYVWPCVSRSRSTSGRGAATGKSHHPLTKEIWHARNDPAASHASVLFDVPEHGGAGSHEPGHVLACGRKDKELPEVDVRRHLDRAQLDRIGKRLLLGRLRLPGVPVAQLLHL